MSSPNNAYYLVSRTITCQLYSNISQILLLYKVWGTITNLAMQSLGILLICQNATVRVWGAWIRIDYVLCKKKKHKSPFGGPFWTDAKGARICETRLLQCYAWWRHQMKTFFAVNGNIFTGKFPSHSQWRGTLMFSLICAWTNGWVNNRDTGDLRRHRAHYDVTVMDLFRDAFLSYSCYESWKIW